MRYLLDTHSLTAAALRDKKYQGKVFVIRDVADEFGTSPQKANLLARSNVQILELELRHFEVLKQILVKHGGNTGLISLLNNEGKGDVLMLAFAVAERNRTDVLFPEVYTIVSEDKELIRVAIDEGIPTMTRLT